MAVREGMSSIIPVPLLSLLTAKQLEQMVCGLPEVSVEMLKKVVRYRDITDSHQLIGWLWQSLEEFTNEERVLFLRFVSGRSRLPSNPADITQKFQIIKVDRVRDKSWLAGPCNLQNHRVHGVGLVEVLWFYDTVRRYLLNFYLDLCLFDCAAI